ncbi:hypothetical protein [Methylocella tundrae]|uniref:Uncharacterized protein n=1 Tax=Methylocella tundrae TaxID=227605 RepID=A0A4V6INI8_METTU|nr:hypothetical protein [Methylocella tundrae]WPP02778.1 hypothetical protein SIN04_00275 [Methylocella tundrae]VFU17569.1 protein of unknown function [Methylocella tundrae]
MAMRDGGSETWEGFEEAGCNLYTLPEFDRLAEEFVRSTPSALKDLTLLFEMIDGQGGARVSSPMYVSARRDFELLMVAHGAEEGAFSAPRVWQDLLARRRSQQKRTRFDMKCKKVVLAAIMMATGLDELNLTIDELGGCLIEQRDMASDPCAKGRATRRGEEFFAKVNEFVARQARSLA